MLMGPVRSVQAMGPSASRSEWCLPASIYLVDESPLGLEGWRHGVHPPPPPEPLPVVEAGAAHFVVRLRGRGGAGADCGARPARVGHHPQGHASIDDGQSHETETTF
jgi:hypothetical protein